MPSLTVLAWSSCLEISSSWTPYRLSLRSLEAGKYIARPFYVQGQRGDQKIFIDKFVCTKGKLKGKMLSFAKTMDWQSPVYVDLTEDTTESQCDNQPVNQPSTLHLFRPGANDRYFRGLRSTDCGQ